MDWGSSPETDQQSYRLLRPPCLGSLPTSTVIFELSESSSGLVGLTERLIESSVFLVQPSEVVFGIYQPRSLSSAPASLVAEVREPSLPGPNIARARGVSIIAVESSACDRRRSLGFFLDVSVEVRR